MARNNEPALRRKTPLLICSIRTEIPYPCIGSRASVLRMSMSSVPWTRSLGLSAMGRIPPEVQEEGYISPTDCQGESETGQSFRRDVRNVRASLKDFWEGAEQTSRSSAIETVDHQGANLPWHTFAGATDCSR